MNELQGREIISIIREAAGPMELIAELMGQMPEYMSRALLELPLANLVFPQLEQFGGPENPADLLLRELSLVTYANHDNAPLATSYLHLQRLALQDSGGKEASELAWLLGFAGWKEDAPEELDARLLGALQSALFKTPCKLAVLMCGDLLGVPLRFNLPGSYGIETWCDRLTSPFEELAAHAVHGSRIATARSLILESGRG
jgi:4-alpha-glucanotransferase